MRLSQPFFLVIADWYHLSGVPWLVQTQTHKHHTMNGNDCDMGWVYGCTIHTLVLGLLGQQRLNGQRDSNHAYPQCKARHSTPHIGLEINA